MDDDLSKERISNISIGPLLKNESIKENLSYMVD